MRVGIMREAVLAMTQLVAEDADFLADAAGGRRRLVEPEHRGVIEELLVHIAGHRIRQCLAADQVVTVEAVFVQLVQVDIVDAGAAVQHLLVNNQAFQVQHAE